MSGPILTAFFLLGATVLPAANYIPLQNGNSWTYRVAGTQQQFTVQVGSPVTMDGRDWFPLTGYTPQRVWVRYEGDRLLYRDESANAESTLTSFLPGDTWPAPMRTCRQRGEAQGTRAKYSGGENALEIRYQTFECADAGTISELYAENIGMVQRTEQSFAGPRTYNLVSARLVSTVTDMASHGRFTVSQQGVTADEVALTLRVEVAHPRPLSMVFGSSQEYDIAVSDDAGKVIYRWSASRSFLQSLHTVVVDAEWNAAVSIPKPAPGVYTLQAWLTTATPEPMYAATVPLVVE
jgi:Intracellular proteinase inhibitor